LNTFWKSQDTVCWLKPKRVSLAMATQFLPAIQTIAAPLCWRIDMVSGVGVRRARASSSRRRARSARQAKSAPDKRSLISRGTMAVAIELRGA